MKETKRDTGLDFIGMIGCFLVGVETLTGNHILFPDQHWFWFIVAMVWFHAAYKFFSRSQAL